jgi:hypothetical protein
MHRTETNLSNFMNAAGVRLKWSALLAGLCWWLAVCLGLWLALFVFDDVLSLPAGLRLPLTLGGAAFSAVYLFQKVLRPAFRKQTPEQTALMLEKQYGIRDNLLINAVQFQRQKLRPEELPFAQQTIVTSSELTERVRFGELWDWRKLRVWGGAATAVLLFWTVFMLFFPRQFSAAATRYALPLGDVPPPGNLVLKVAPAGDVTVAEGESLDVSLAVDAPGHQPLSRPPVIVWKERDDFVQPIQSAGENAVMTPAVEVNQNPEPGAEATQANAKFLHTFANIQTPFAFRVFAGDSYTRSIQVKVRPTPRLKDAFFRVTPPAYTGQKPQDLPGPPAPIAALPGSTVEISFKVEPAIESADWTENSNRIEFKYSGGRWETTATIAKAGAYEIPVRFASDDKPMTLARGEIQLLTDNPPDVDFVTEDRNRLVQFGQTLKLDVQARDDFGIADVWVVARPADKEDAGTVLKRWTYLGPPGNPGPVRETFSFVIDSRSFDSGASYYLEAMANDFRPDGTPSKSRPIVLRIRSEDEIALRDGDPLAPAFEELKRAIASQETANHLTANMQTYLDEIVEKDRVAAQAAAVGTDENEARNHSREAAVIFERQPEGQLYAGPLNTLWSKDMADVQNDLRGLPTTRNELQARLANIGKREEQILDRLRDLLGRLADAHSDKLSPAADGKDTAQPPAGAQEERAKQLLDDLKNFVADEERVLEKSRTLADKGPEDLSQAEKETLGELAREEGKWAKFFEEKLTDFSKLPSQDFADASLAQELNSVYQEIQKADDALSQKKLDLAVPLEQSGLENAKKLENNLERWLPDQPDNIKWSMEEPATMADIALAELPKELEDIVGELLDKEQAMTPDIQDVTSSWMDSLDKGAGWGTGDGPISDMSARGVTGNLLPNQNEVGGRSGEGRNGRSHGQMVSDTAEGKGGQETPTRLTPEPFEQGNVKDSAKTDGGGATGGGKLSGAAGEGLRGPSPPSSGGKMPRLADQQAKIRQQAEALALKLRRYHVSSGALETSVNAMDYLEDAARKDDGLGVRRAFSQAVSDLVQAKKTVDDQVSVRREQDKLPGWMRDEIRTGVQDGIPKGYEEMVGEYFRALADGRTK